MLLVTRVFLLLGFSSVLPAASKKRFVPLQLGQDISLRGKTVKLVLDPSVNSYLSFRSASNVANLSLSPLDLHRFFQLLPFTRKDLAGQLQHIWLSEHPRGGEDLTLEAKPIKYQVLVLYRSRKERKNKKVGKKAKKKYVFCWGLKRSQSAVLV